MKRHLIAVAATIVALAAGVGTANAADPPGVPGADQGLGQLSGSLQGTPSASDAGQSASNVSSPYAPSGSGVAIPSAPSSATQNANNTADSTAANTSTTNQTAIPTQTGGSSCTTGCGGGSPGCVSGCGGPGQEQNVAQLSGTQQDADSTATADQNAVNANVPVNVAGGSVSSGPSSATQNANNTGTSSATNTSTTNQTANPTQTAPSSSCQSGCGGAGQEQNVIQASLTKQDADSDATAKQNAVNANVPVSIAGGDVNSGPSSATQNLNNTADSTAKNTSTTSQTANPTQKAGSSSCFSGCGGNGQEQNVLQASLTKQDADSDATAKQNAVNANVPVSIAGGDVNSGPSSATQNANNTADSNASNKSDTKQTANPSQIGGSSSCGGGCGGDGQEQNVIQASLTKQDADSDATAKQNAVNANVPVSIGGGKSKCECGGDDPPVLAPPASSSATQNLSNTATSKATNDSTTTQNAMPTQLGGAGDCRSTCGGSSCKSGCGGNGQEQNVVQIGLTKQDADSDALAKQNAVNANAPVLVGGSGPFGVGSSSATQNANNTADSTAKNTSTTKQTAIPSQSIAGSQCGCEHGSGIGGNGQEQNVLQVGLTKQDADSDATAKQDATNVDVPVLIGGSKGHDLKGGDDPSATQNLNNTATSNASNTSTTTQNATAKQEGASPGCKSGCGGNGQEQNVLQIGLTKQDADSDAFAKQDAVNANAPILLGGSPFGGGSSSATQNLNNKADSSATNKSTTDQSAIVSQSLAPSKCGCEKASGKGGDGQEQNVLQIGITKQDADSDAFAKQHAVNANVPFSVGGWSPFGPGSSSATQNANNTATSKAPNTSTTHQSAIASQSLDGAKCSCGGSGKGGSGQEQNVLGISFTKQDSDSNAKSKQELTNADVPISFWLSRPKKDRKAVMV